MNTDIIRHLTPTCLALIAVELEEADRNRAEDNFLDGVNEALDANVGEKEADELRDWVRKNI